MRQHWTARLSRSGSRFLLGLTIICAAGCSAQKTRHFETTASAAEVADTPFYPQERFQCGPAALLTVLEYSGADASLDDLVEAVYVPGREGSFQQELLAATRAAGRIPYLVDGNLDAIASQLDSGRPVLVLQNLGVSWLPRWHYAVVYRADPVNDSVSLRSGTDRERRTRAGTFMQTWDRADNWGFVVLEPGELPADPDRDRYFRAVAGLEETGHATEALVAWLAAVDQWPDSPIPMFGAGNAELALENYASAERRYRQLLARWPTQTIARNNLAIALARQGRTEAAVAVIEDALARPGLAPGLSRILRDTLREVDSQTR